MEHVTFRNRGMKPLPPGSVIIIPGFSKKVVQQMDSTKAGKTPRWNTFIRP